MKKFKGKAIYQPAGKAAEYSEWACNFYVGCSGGCTYCYLKKGRGSAILGGTKPKLKACFRNESHAIEIFYKEINQNLEELRANGLFFSFTTDPMLLETIDLTLDAMFLAIKNDIPVKVLTKNGNFVNYTVFSQYFPLSRPNLRPKLRYIVHTKSLVSFGFTLTGHDGLEPGTSTNQERIEAMRKLHDYGFKTFASIEPVIDFESSLQMIDATKDFCDLYKIGLESGKEKDYHYLKYLNLFIHQILKRYSLNKVYFKDSILKAARINREDLPSNCVNRDFKLHEL